MADFPTLKSGAIAQYPAEAGVAFSTHVSRFLDGTEQRFRSRREAGRRWEVRLDLLDDREARVLREFFESQQGGYGTFSFQDPQSLTTYPNCSFENGDLGVLQNEEYDHSMRVIIRTNAS